MGVYVLTCGTWDWDWAHEVVFQFNYNALVNDGYFVGYLGADVATCYSEFELRLSCSNVLIERFVLTTVDWMFGLNLE